MIIDILLTLSDTVKENKSPMTAQRSYLFEPMFKQE